MLIIGQSMRLGAPAYSTNVLGCNLISHETWSYACSLTWSVCVCVCVEIVHSYLFFLRGHKIVPN